MTIRMPDDVLLHFGAEANPTSWEHGQSLDLWNARLTRRIYRDTTCGAWAKLVAEPNPPMAELWRARYAIVDNLWTLAACERTMRGSDEPAMGIPPEVNQYFWPQSDEWVYAPLMRPVRRVMHCGHEDCHQHPELGRACTDMQTYLRGLYPAQSDVWTDRTIIEVSRGTRLVFHVGTIVEGSDAEWSTFVRLPCLPEDLDNVVRDVEEWAAGEAENLALEA